MIQKKVKHSTQIASKENRVIKETIRKSRIAASNEFEFRKLVRRQERFLNCSMEEEKESLIVIYEIQNLLPWTEIRHEKRYASRPLAVMLEPYDIMNNSQDSLAKVTETDIQMMIMAAFTKEWQSFMAYDGYTQSKGATTNGACTSE